MNLETATPEQADRYWQDMGEPPSSRSYLRTIYFDGEPVLVQRPSPVYPNPNTGD